MTPRTPVEQSRLAAAVDEELDPTITLLGRLIAEESVDGSGAIDRCLWLGNAGIATVLCGPGAPDQAHTTGERVHISEIRDAMLIYARLILAAGSPYGSPGGDLEPVR